MNSLDLRQRLQKALAGASEAHRSGFIDFSEDGKRKMDGERYIDPRIELVRCLHEAREALAEAKRLGDYAIMQEGLPILERMVQMLEEKNKEHDIFLARLDRITRRLGG